MLSDKIEFFSQNTKKKVESTAVKDDKKKTMTMMPVLNINENKITFDEKVISEIFESWPSFLNNGLLTEPTEELSLDRDKTLNFVFYIVGRDIQKKNTELTESQNAWIKILEQKVDKKIISKLNLKGPSDETEEDCIQFQYRLLFWHVSLEEEKDTAKTISNSKNSHKEATIQKFSMETIFQTFSKETVKMISDSEKQKKDWFFEQLCLNFTEKIRERFNDCKKEYLSSLSGEINNFIQIEIKEEAKISKYITETDKIKSIIKKKFENKKKNKQQRPMTDPKNDYIDILKTRRKALTSPSKAVVSMDNKVQETVPEIENCLRILSEKEKEVNRNEVFKYKRKRFLTAYYKTLIKKIDELQLEQLTENFPSKNFKFFEQLDSYLKKIEEKAIESKAKGFFIFFDEENMRIDEENKRKNILTCLYDFTSKQKQIVKNLESNVLTKSLLEENKSFKSKTIKLSDFFTSIPFLANEVAKYVPHEENESKDAIKKYGEEMIKSKLKRMIQSHVVKNLDDQYTEKKKEPDACIKRQINIIGSFPENKTQVYQIGKTKTTAFEDLYVKKSENEKSENVFLMDRFKEDIFDCAGIKFYENEKK